MLSSWQLTVECDTLTLNAFLLIDEDCGYFVPKNILVGLETVIYLV